MHPYSRVSFSLWVSRRSFFVGRPAPRFRVSKTVLFVSFFSVSLASGGAKSVYSSAASLAGPRRVPRASICITLIWFACGKVNVWPICAWRCGLDMTSPFRRNFLPEISLVAALLVLKKRAYHNHLSRRRPLSEEGIFICCPQPLSAP